MKYVATFLVLLGSTHFAPRAHACSIAIVELEEASLPISGATTGPMPLLVTTTTVAQLRNAHGTVIAIVADPLLDGALSQGVDVTAWRPAAPLPGGEYRWLGRGSEYSFFVDPELDEVTPVLTDTSFRVVRDRPDGSSGCEEDSCHDVDFTHAEVGFTSESRVQHVLLELVDETSGARRVTFGTSGRPWPPSDATSFTHGTSVFDGSTNLDLGDHRICATLTPFGEDGVVGEPIDLGCSSPSSGKNFVDKDGCASTQATDTYLILMALGLVVTRRRWLP